MTDLTMAWVRRKRFEAQLIAGELAGLLAQAMGNGQPVRARTSNPRTDRIPADQLLGEMGIMIQ